MCEIVFGLGRRRTRGRKRGKRETGLGWEGREVKRKRRKVSFPRSSFLPPRLSVGESAAPIGLSLSLSPPALLLLFSLSLSSSSSSSSSYLERQRHGLRVDGQGRLGHGARGRLPLGRRRGRQGGGGGVRSGVRRDSCDAARGMGGVAPGDLRRGFSFPFGFVSRKIIVSACVLGRLARRRGKEKGALSSNSSLLAKQEEDELSRNAAGRPGQALPFFLPRPSLFQLSLVPRSLSTLLNSLCSSQLKKAGISRSKCAERRGDVEREEREREKELEPQVAWGASRELTRKA